ncbi:MAG TPA: hypothetical protein VGF17_18325 [Phytomonospora sp.]
MAVPGPSGPHAGGPEERTPPAATGTPWQPAKGRIYRATGAYDEPQTLPNGFTPPQPVLPKTKGPWALTHLTTSLTGDILGGHRHGPGPAKPPERGTMGRIAIGMAIGILVLAAVGVLGAFLLGLF